MFYGSGFWTSWPGGLCVGCLYCCFAVCVVCDLLDAPVWVVVSADFGLWVGGFFLDLVDWVMRVVLILLPFGWVLDGC